MKKTIVSTALTVDVVKKLKKTFSTVYKGLEVSTAVFFTLQKQAEDEIFTMVSPDEIERLKEALIDSNINLLLKVKPQILEKLTINKEKNANLILIINELCEINCFFLYLKLEINKRSNYESF